MKKILKFVAILALLAVIAFVRFLESPIQTPIDEPVHFNEVIVYEDEEYTSMEEVACYIHEFGKLPSNYITKTKATKAGWIAEEGNLWEVTDHKSIGGGEYKNLEGILPEKSGRTYRECDIDYEGGPRNGKRIVYSNDGLIYYTEDHYESFILLFGED